jgi:hypothetical protein
MKYVDGADEFPIRMILVAPCFVFIITDFILLLSLL